MGRRSRRKKQTDDDAAVGGESDPNRDAGSRSPARFRGWRGWVLRLSLLFLSPVLFFGLLEAGLRIGGYGYPTDFFVEADAEGTYTTNDDFGRRFFPPSLLRYARPSVLAEKSPETIRIFVLGGSAAMGFPDPAFSLSRMVAVMLREMYPEMQFEVINSAMTAINSHVTLEIARGCAAHEPDVFIVYVGNNEVIGPYGPGTVFQQWTPSLRVVRTSLWAKSTRTGQLIGDIASYFEGDQDVPSHWLGMEMFQNNLVASDDPRLTTVYDSYRRNLIDICGVAQSAGAKVVLSTVAVNLHGCPPFASTHRRDLAPEELKQWELHYQAGRDLAADEQWREALNRFNAAAEIDDRFAELQFYIGQCLTHCEHDEEARNRFAMARDLDSLRFRADSQLNAIVGEVAAKEGFNGVGCVDAAQMFEESDPASENSSGRGLFHEHVHLTFAGNYLLARAILDQVCTTLPRLSTLEQRTVPSRQRCAELLAWTPWSEYTIAETMVAFTSRPPFTNQLHHDVRQATVRQRRDELRKEASKPEAMEKSWGICVAALDKDPDDWCLREQLALLAIQLDRPEVAVEHLRPALKMMPHRASLHRNFGAALDALGQTDEAISHYQLALEIDPGDAMAHFNLANTLARRGQTDEAVTHYKRTVEIEPEYSMAHYGLGSMAALRKEYDAAIGHYRKAVEIQPDNVLARYSLGSLAAVRGQVDQAMSHFRQVLEIQPEHAAAHNSLANLLEVRGMGDEAITHYQKAAELTADETAQQTLEAAQSTRKQILSAIAQRRDSLRSSPKDTAILNETAWLLATSPYATVRNGRDAVEFAQRAAEISERKIPEILATLAAAYAETGQFAEAVETSREAVELAKAQKNEALVERIEFMAQSYAAGTHIRQLQRTSVKK